MSKNFLIKKTTLLLLLVLAINFSLSNVAHATDNQDIYGDGISASWNDITPYLSAIYKSTPYISISNGISTMQFSFNTELFWDLGLYVYGDPLSVSFTDTKNDFKVTEKGYFKNKNSSKRGEYRYLGYSINGAPITNTRFPNEIKPIPYEDMTLIKYSDLSESLKKTYSIIGVNNNSYSSIKHVIEDKNSPIWNFTNFTQGKEISLKQTLINIGMFKNGRATVSLLDYGIIYSWNDSGGIIRLFYCSKHDKSIVRYATFSGPVSIDIHKITPTLTSALSLNKSKYYISGTTFSVPSNTNKLLLNIDITGVFNDNYKNLSYLQKKFSVTRDSIVKFELFVENKIAKEYLFNSDSTKIKKGALITNHELKLSNLKKGNNYYTIKGKALISLKDGYLEAPCSLVINVICNDVASPEKPSSSPSPTNTPKPTSTLPTVTPNPTPTLPPRITINRKW